MRHWIWRSCVALTFASLPVGLLAPSSPAWGIMQAIAVVVGVAACFGPWRQRTF